MIAIAAHWAHGPDADADSFERALDHLVALGNVSGETRRQIETALASELARSVRVLWDNGWQPFDLVHVVRRQCGVRISRLCTTTVAVDAAASGAVLRAPQVWIDQLTALGAADSSISIYEIVPRWIEQEGLSVHEGWGGALRLIGALRWQPRLTFLQPPPKEWDASGPRRRSSGGTVGEPKMLARIRALLAKAEATTFVEEADAFTAKAQELMARHAIDAAAVESSATPGGARAGVAVKRLHIDDPYAEPKMYLLASVAQANSVRVVWNGRLSIATVFGFAIDLELVELMFTSLLVQATRAAADLGKTSRQARSASFRRAFVTAYASRIGERLRQARVQAETEATSEYGTALVPILASRRDAVDDAVNEAFPETTRSRPRAVDAHGWRAGRLAADLADLGQDFQTLAS